MGYRRLYRYADRHSPAEEKPPLFSSGGFDSDTEEESYFPYTEEAPQSEPLDAQSKETILQRLAWAKDQPNFLESLSRPAVIPQCWGKTVPVQAKLTIGPANDHYEQQADQVADQVVQQINSPTIAQSPQEPSVNRQEDTEETALQPQRQISTLQRSPAFSALQRELMQVEERPQPNFNPMRSSPGKRALQRELMRMEERPQPRVKIQRRAETAEGEASADLTTAIDQARGRGWPLDPRLQASMGQAMGADFSGVRVHTDGQADELNQSIQAKAFTTGQDVFFRRGEYNPGSRGGQGLIAHELTHVVQQDPEELSNVNTQRIQRTGIHWGKNLIPGTQEENDENFQSPMRETIDSKRTKDAKERYINEIKGKFKNLPERTHWDNRMIVWLETMRGGKEEEEIGREMSMQGMEEETTPEAFEQTQKAYMPTVMRALAKADEKISAAIEAISMAGNTEDQRYIKNLQEVNKYLQRKGALYDEGHFLCSPSEAGDINELAHSKKDGTIELFKGFFDSLETIQADLLVHEAVHSVFKVPDYAYMWQQIFRFLPVETGLQNPDSYVAVIRKHTGEAVETPTTHPDNEGYDKILGQIQNICMRGGAMMEVCQKQLEAQEMGDPLATLRKNRPQEKGWTNELLGSLITQAIHWGKKVTRMVHNKEIKIIPERPRGGDEGTERPAEVGGQSAMIFEHPPKDKPRPDLEILARIIGEQNGKSVARALNDVFEGRLMKSTTLLPTEQAK